MSATVRALDSAYLGTLTGPVQIVKGQEFNADDPLVKSHPALFSQPVDEPRVAQSRVVPSRLKRNG